MAPTPDFTDDGLMYLRVTQDSVHNTPTTDLEYNQLQEQYRERTDTQYSRFSNHGLNKKLSASRISLKSDKNQSENQSWIWRNWGWLITLCCFVYNFVYMGFLCCFALLFVYLQEDFRSSATETGKLRAIN